jgi:hypothetical protein
MQPYDPFVRTRDRGLAPLHAHQVPSIHQRSLAMPDPIVGTRAPAIALVACSMVLLVGLVSHAWFTTGGYSLGLIGAEDCDRYACKTLTRLDLLHTPSELRLFASLGLLGGLTALGFMIHAAIVLFKHQPHRVRLTWLNSMLGVAAFGCFSFFFHLTFGEMSKHLAMSYAGFLAMGSILAASIIVASMVRPLMRLSR